MRKEFVHIDRLKEFSQFILDRYVDEFVQADLQRAKEVDLPLMRLFSHLSKEEVFDYFKKSCVNFLTEITQGKNFEAFDVFIENLKENKVEGLPKDKVVVEDISLSYNIRKHSFFKFIPLFTTDINEGVKIIKEIEDFYTQRQHLVFEAYTEINVEALKSSEKNFKSLAEASFEGIIIHNNEIIIEANQEVAKIFGYSKEEILGKNIKILNPEFEHQFIQERLKAQSEEPYETIGVKNDGSLFPIEVVGRKIIFKGKVMRVVGIRDITERKKQEEKLREQQRTFQTILDSIPVMVFWVNTQHKLLGYNKTFQQVINLPDEALLNKNAYEIFPGGEKYLKDDIEVMKTGAPKLNIVESVITPDRTFWLKTDKVPLKNSKGEIIGVIGSAIDITELKNTQEKLNSLNADLELRVERRTIDLQESEQRYRFMAETIPAIVWTALPNGSIDYLSKKFQEFSGTAENANTFLQNYTHPEDLPVLLQTWKKSLVSGEEFKLEHRLKGKDGSYRWMLSRAIPQKGLDAKVLKWFGTSTDIHDQKKAQEDLRMQARVLENMNEGVIVTDEEGMMIYTNRTQDKMFRYNSGELLGKNVSILNSSEENEKKGKEVISILKAQGKYSGNWKNKRKDGSIFFSSSHISSLNLGDKKLFVSLQRDITEELRNKEALDYQSKLNKTITDNATSCLFMMNKKGYVTFMNPAGEKMFGYTLDEIKQKPLHYLIHHHKPDGSEYLMEDCPIDRALPDNFDIRAHEDLFFRKDGSAFPVVCAASPIFENGVPVATVIEVRDITEEKKFKETILKNNEQLKKINNDLDNFIYTASHDLKAPVSNIEGLVNTLNDAVTQDTTESEDFKMVMDLISKSINRFKITIQDLTDISKAQRNFDKEETLVDVSKEALEVKENLREEILKTKAEIIISTENCPFIKFSNKNFRSIMYNLINNAIKYHSPDRAPKIEIKSYKISDYYVLKVKDNGLGIKEEHKGKIFEMFKRLHDHVEGSGVGLYIVRRMVDNAGGKIEVDSVPGEGSTFTVFFKE